MKEKNEPYRQDVAFMDRNKELADLILFIDKRPSEIFFINSPKLLRWFGCRNSTDLFLTTVVACRYGDY